MLNLSFGDPHVLDISFNESENVFSNDFRPDANAVETILIR